MLQWITYTEHIVSRRPDSLTLRGVPGSRRRSYSAAVAAASTGSLSPGRTMFSKLKAPLLTTPFRWRSGGSMMRCESRLRLRELREEPTRTEFSDDREPKLEQLG